MMERFREGVNGPFVKIVLGLIILSFVFAGVGSYIIGGNANSAAKVGNAEITRGDFEQAYQNERNRMQSQLGDYFSNMLADPAYVESFRKSVLDRMVNDLLLEQHAESLGLRVSDAQIRTMILEMPQFQSNGQFDQDIYQTGLRRAGFSAESFAQYLRRDLTRNQLLTALQNSDFSLDGEVNAQSELIMQTRDIRTIKLSVADMARNIELTEAEIEAFYDENSVRYTRPEQVKVGYVELSAQQLKQSIEVSEPELKKYYQEHLDKYSTEEQRKVSHILVQGELEAAEKILADLKSGADFATLAEELSQDIGSAEEGGSLGWIERDVMDPSFETAAFELANVGDISEVVTSNFGYHIIKLDELKDSVSQPFEAVKEDILADLVDQKAVDAFYELQSEFERIAFEYPDSLDDAAAAVSQPIQVTDFISAQDAPEILRSSAVMQAILSPEVMEDGLNSEVIEVSPEHVIVVRVDDSREETVLPLNDVRDQVEAQLRQVKGEQVAIELAGNVLEVLSVSDESQLSEYDLQFSESTSIDRRAPLAETVFSMAKPLDGQAVYAQAKDFEGNIVIVALDKVDVNVDTQFASQVDAQLVQLSNQQDLSGILSILRENTDIDYFIVGQ
ncbi:peptidylprolyl isomerase [Vibrio genomosp. F10 str. ZF-129]|uniref:Periplasmic chaperone PpiD n=1 Tax=Vibrio genomosp. F10 str. ZF-129 TaxID=1187848 RepID=A0A1E5BHK2_9VIBR|nr:peptidylprolyl isomerase [Vibrio genomosp. F10]OEE36530.1 peptidylprolyl isomerase [Vibrio genomosp. F10 str. ZF-129]